MKFFMFRSASDDNLSALTDDEAGVKLPTEHSPWLKDGGSVLPPDAGSSQIFNHITSAIEIDGYYLMNSRPDHMDDRNFNIH